MVKKIKLYYKDAFGTFNSAIVEVNEQLEVLNLELLPYDLQNQLIAGVYDNELLDLEGCHAA
ncbi:MAG: hypothetical protein OEL54_05760 [Flavobacteriaceae bacterium]|nr:hypothetical protein [Flavobacteriaceae bacterium]